MALLQGLQGLFVPLDGGLQLFDILGPSLSKGCLGLAVPLFALFGSSVNLVTDIRPALAS